MNNVPNGTIIRQTLAISLAILVGLPLMTWAVGMEEIVLLSIGTALPPLKGQFLNGKQAILPDAARGRIALLALGFSYNSRFAVEDWSRRFGKEFQGNGQVTFYEIPMIGGLARMGRWFIDSGMRKATPKELHENVVTVYGGIDPWKKRLGYKHADAAYLILLDSTGKIHWLHQGLFDATAFSELAATTRALLGQVP